MELQYIWSSSPFPVGKILSVFGAQILTASNPTVIVLLGVLNMFMSFLTHYYYTMKLTRNCQIYALLFFSHIGSAVENLVFLK